MESIPPQPRGLVSGVLQCGYPCGFQLAAVAMIIIIRFSPERRGELLKAH